ncbi:MAG: DUF3822 family protein [Bacteroidales bacterium]|jgi:hypothetical protein|nr:DUF3822 family protein [Bacteroidales bacterium]
MADLFTLVVNKLDESFDIQETRNYGLSLVFSETGFSYAVLDFRHNKYLGIQQVKKNDHSHGQGVPAVKPSFDDFLINAFDAMPWLKNQYKTIKIAYEGKKSTLIPSLLYDVKEREHYLQFGFSNSLEEKTFSDHLVPLDIQHVFTIPVAIFNSIKVHYPSVNIVHFSSVVIKSIWINYKNRINTARVFLHIRENRFDLMIFDGRQMSYFNSFPFQNGEDICYYLIFVIEQLNHNPEIMPLVLLGNIEKSAPDFELLYKYIRNIEFAHRNDAFIYSNTLNQFPPHFFYPLLNFQACGL